MSLLNVFLGRSEGLVLITTNVAGPGRFVVPRILRGRVWLGALAVIWTDQILGLVLPQGQLVRVF